MKKIANIWNFGAACIASVLLFASILLMIDFSRVDNLPYDKTVEEVAISLSDFTDSESPFDSVAGNTLLVGAGGERKQFSTEISLTDTGDSLLVRFDLYNASENNAAIGVDLYAPDFDHEYNQFIQIVTPGMNSIKGELPYSRGIHPEICEFRFFTYYQADMEISNLQVDRQIAVRDGHPLVLAGIGVMAVICALSALYLVFYIVYQVKSRDKQEKMGLRAISGAVKRGKAEVAMYAIMAAIVTGMLMILYRNANLLYPLAYGNGDEMGIFYLVKTISEHGTTLVNPMNGGITGGDMFDYPYSDKLSFLLVKCISLFTSNVYLITNLFYFLSFYLIAFTSLFVCRKLELSKPVSVLVAVLYAFSPFIRGRYAHMWLVPYYMLPLACMIAIFILEGKILNSSVSILQNKRFWGFMIVSYFCAFTGLYYAYFACALFAVAMVIRVVNAKNGKGVRKELYPVAFIVSTIAGVVTNVLPNLMYWCIHGINTASELVVRGRADAEKYALKFVQMLLPRSGHRISELAEITATYNATYPLVNENASTSLGLVASIGFLLSILFLFINQAQTRYKSLSYFNIATFLIATIGGVGSVISVLVTLPVRSYNRMSLVIMFLSLVLVATLLDHAFRAKRRKAWLAPLCGCIMVVGLYDQTVDYTPPNYSSFESTVNLIDEIENTLDEGDMVFQLPYCNWPSQGNYKQHMGYIESDNIRWNYGAMQGREEALWQKAVAESDVDVMIKQLKEAGYDGIYFDTVLYTNVHKEEKTMEDSNSITALLGEPAIVSEDGTTYFWDIRS